MLFGCAASVAEIFAGSGLEMRIKSGIALFYTLHSEPLSRVSVAKFCITYLRGV